MAMQNNTQRQTDALNKVRNDIANLTGWLECELQKHEAQDISWGTVSSLEHVRENLTETLAFLSGIDQAEIIRSLDELDEPPACETKTTEQAEAAIAEIAKRHLRVKTLDEQRIDRLDFHDLHVASIKEALLAAFKAGQESAK